MRGRVVTNKMHMTLPALVATGLAALPVTSAFASQPKVSTTPTAVPTKAPAKAKTYKGPLVDMRWGPVQAILKVKSKKITKVTIVVNPDTRRSQFIDDNAVPILKSETMQAQNANIDTVSGATMTSEAYIQSLQSALKKAHMKVA